MSLSYRLPPFWRVPFIDSIHSCNLVSFSAFCDALCAVTPWTLSEDPSLPRLPDPNLIFPPTPRRRFQPERPKTLDILARPRPCPRARCGSQWGESPAHTSSTETPSTVEFGGGVAVLPTPMEQPTPCSPWVNESLLDQQDEGQYRDGTRPISSDSRDSPYRVRPGFCS